MKKTFLLLIAFIAIQSLSLAQGTWSWQMPQQLHHTVSDIRFFSLEKFYIAGGNGDFWKTADGGKTYVQANIAEKAGNNSLFFLDENEGWALNSRGKVFHTKDAGATWEKQFDQATVGTLTEISFKDQNTGYIGGNSGYVDNVIFKTTDGGKTWEEIKTLPSKTADFSGIFYVKAFQGDTVVAISWNNLFYKSVNAGVSWDTIQIDPSRRTSFHEGAYFTDASHGWVVGPQQSIVHTSDFGTTWTNQLSGDNSDYFSEVYFLDNQRGFASAFENGGCNYTTLDGGKTWTRECGKGSAFRKSGVYFTDMNNGIIYGSTAVEKTDDGGKSFTNLLTNYAGTFTSAAFPAKNNGLAVSDKGDVFRTNDGKTWTKNAQQFQSLNTIVMLDGQTGFAAGNGGTIIKTTDGGATFTSLKSGSTTNLKAISASGNNVLVAAGDSNAILRSTDLGSTWKLTTVKSKNNLTGIQMMTASKGIAVGSSSYIAATSDGGQTWKPVNVDIIRNLSAVYFPDENTGYIVGASGTILKSTDGGQNWLPQVSGTITSLNTVFFTDSETGWAAGTGTLLRTMDGGQTWTVDESFLSGNSVRKLIFTDTHTGWAFTSLGGILKYKAIATGTAPEYVIQPASVYPMPAKDYIFVSGTKSSMLNLAVYDLTGRVRSQQSASKEEGFDISALGAGLYIGKVTDGNVSHTVKILKQ